MDVAVLARTKFSPDTPYGIAMPHPIRFAFSPCPNDTFSFHALVRKLIPTGDFSISAELADVETLNQAARAGRYDMTKLSFAALGHLLDRYALLRSGAALGRGCGPLVVARPGFDPARLAGAPVAIPGAWTTAALLLGLYRGGPGPTAAMPFDQILPAVAEGRFDAGVIIHEGRFTFGAHGLVEVIDLGEWWESETGLPIPLGGIAVRRDLGPEAAAVLEQAVRESVAHAFANPDASADYVRDHAQEMEPEVVRRHIDLYVTDFSMELGQEGEAAVSGLLDRARAAGLIPDADLPVYSAGTDFGR
jgi:1,4-dihydroxy-6-naphthoate synthase